MGSDLQLNVVTFKKDAYVIVEGKNSNNLFFIIKAGQVCLVKEGSNNREMLNPGDFFGVIAAMSNHNHLESAIALTDIMLIVVHKDQFPLLIQKNNPIAMKIILSFSRRLRELDTSMAEISLKSISTENVVNLFHIGEFYLKKNRYNLAFYAFFRFLQYCPDNEEYDLAKQILEKIKPYSKVLYLDPGKDDFKRNYTDNTMVCCEHEPGHELYIIQGGQVKITKVMDNKEVLLAVLKEGDIFGEMALLENKPRSATAIAYGSAQIMAVNKENFKNMISSQPQLVTRLICLLAERTWVVYRQLENLKITNKVGRTYDTLLIHLEKNKIQIKPHGTYSFDFGPNELINMVGMQHDEGMIMIKEVFNNKKVQIIDDRIYCSDIEEIKKQVDYYKKMEILDKKRKASST